jgi:hypothetical protein
MHCHGIHTCVDNASHIYAYWLQFKKFVEIMLSIKLKFVKFRLEKHDFDLYKGLFMEKN